METLIPLIVLGVMVVALVVAVIVCVRRISKLGAEKFSLVEEKNALAARTASLEAEIKVREQAQREMDSQREESLKALSEERAKAFESQRKQMEESFKLLSEQNSAGLRRQNAESITELLKPIRETFDKFDKTVHESQEKSVEQSASMKTLIEQVMERSKTVGDEAKNLANALTGYSKVQGDFGEMLLTDLLKSSGLVEGVHFTTQGVITDEHGHEIRNDSGGVMIPDVIVYYPDDTLVIVDSKVSLTSYQNYMNATGVEERRRLAKAHVDSVRSHVDELKTKAYASYIPEGKSKFSYNLMFIPMEGAFRLALEEDPMLWQVAKRNNVMIVSPMTLSIVLNMVEMSWRQYNQEKNIADVYHAGEELMSQIKGWLDSYLKIGEFLGKASQAFDDSKKKLTEGNQNVMKKIDKLERLGLGPKRSNARIKTTGRMIAGRESVIPMELSPEEDDNNA